MSCFVAGIFSVFLSLKNTIDRRKAEEHSKSVWEMAKYYFRRFGQWISQRVGWIKERIKSFWEWFKENAVGLARLVVTVVSFASTVCVVM